MYTTVCLSYLKSKPSRQGPWIATTKAYPWSGVGNTVLGTGKPHKCGQVRKPANNH